MSPSLSPTPAGTFDAFMSYSRRDTLFAERLHAALERYAPPKGVRATQARLRVFRDVNDVSGSEYFHAIEAHLSASTKLIVICSPAAASSTWVDDEIARFIRLHGAESVVPVLWLGLPNNEATANRVAERAFPPALASALSMPLAADFRGLDVAKQRPDSEAFRSAWMLLLSTLLGVSRAELEQREFKRRRATRRRWTTGLSTVALSLLALTTWALIEGERALARQLSAQSAQTGGLELPDVERRVLIGREAVERLMRLGEPLTGAESGLRDGLASLPRRRLALSAGQIQVAFSADGALLLAVEGQSLVVRSLVNSAELRRVSLMQPVHSLSVAANGNYIAAIGDDGTPLVWEWPQLETSNARDGSDANGNVAGIASTRSFLPVSVLAAPISCLSFVGSGESVVALRVRPTDPRHAELMRWIPGQPMLLDSARVSLPQAVAPPSDGECLRSRVMESGDSWVAAVLPQRLTEVGQDTLNVAVLWTLSKAVSTFPGLPRPKSTSPRVFDAIRRLSVANNGTALVVDSANGVARESREPATSLGQQSPSGNKVGEGWKAGLPRESSTLTLSPHGNWVARAHGGEDPIVPLLRPTRIDLLDAVTGAVVRTFADQGATATFTPDEEQLVTISERRVRFWDRRDGRERLRLHSSAPIARLQFDPTSRSVAVIATDGSLEVFDIGGADEQFRAAPGTVVALTTEPWQAVFVNEHTVRWRTDAYSMPRSLRLERTVRSVIASRDGRRAAVVLTAPGELFSFGSDSGRTLVLLDQVGDSLKTTYRGRAGALKFDALGARLLVAGVDDTVRLVDVSSGRVQWVRHVPLLRSPPGGALAGWRLPLALSEDGSVLAVADTSGLTILSGENGRALSRIEAPRDSVSTQRSSLNAVALSKTGSLLALSWSGSVSIYHTVDGSHQVRMGTHNGQAQRGLMFSPNGKQLLGVGGTGFSTFMVGGLYTQEHLLLWNAGTGALVQRVPSAGVIPDDYAASVGVQGEEPQQLTQLVWSDHSREVAGMLYPSLLAYWTVPSSDVRGALTSWQLTDHGLEERYRGAPGEVGRLTSMAQGGGVVLAVGADDQQRAISLSGEPLLAASCRWVTRSFSANERSETLGTGWRSPFRCPRPGNAVLPSFKSP